MQLDLLLLRQLHLLHRLVVLRVFLVLVLVALQLFQGALQALVLGLQLFLGEQTKGRSVTEESATFSERTI